MRRNREEISPLVGKVSISTQSAEETRALGRQLGRLLRGGDVIALQGELGAGKTTFTQGIARGLGVDAFVRSPTFTLVNEYDLPGDGVLFHIDGYRLGETMSEAMIEADTFGMEQMLEDDESIAVIEWADRIADLLPSDFLDVQLAYVEQMEAGRTLTLCARGPRGEEILRGIG
jgi:tRNA threonylcarbamoyladenosine biosynthesis protein TsaE